MVFCPYRYKSELNTEDDNKATEKVLFGLDVQFAGGKEKLSLSLFTHFAISDSLTSSNS